MDSCRPNSAEKYATGRGRRTPACVAPQVRSACEIFPLAAIGVVDAAVQHQFAGAALHLRQRNLRQQSDGIVIELPPAHRIEVAEQAAGVVVPAPPQIARQRPEPLLGGRDEAIQSASFADHRRHLGRGLASACGFRLRERRAARWSGPPARPAARRDRSAERPETTGSASSPASLKYLKRGWFFTCSTATGRTCSATRPARPSCSPMRRVPMHCGTKTHSRGQHQVGAVRLQQICGTDIGLKALGDQSDNIHQRFGRFAALGGQIADFLQGQDVISSCAGAGWLMF